MNVQITCHRKGCGVTWWVTSGFEAARRSDHAMFYCPNGHAQYYPHRSDADKLKDLGRDLRACRGRAAKLTRELAKKPCPYCDKRLANLARHIKSQHPGKPMPTKKGA